MNKSGLTTTNDFKIILSNDQNQQNHRFTEVEIFTIKHLNPFLENIISAKSVPGLVNLLPR